MDNADDLLSRQVRVAGVGSNHDVEIMSESVMCDEAVCVHLHWVGP